MAKSAGSKVIFVPMQLQSDVVGKLASLASGPNMGANESGEGGMGGWPRRWFDEMRVQK
jgi:erythrocyte band 7 integral membrane protein